MWHGDRGFGVNGTSGILTVKGLLGKVAAVTWVIIGSVKYKGSAGAYTISG